MLASPHLFRKEKKSLRRSLKRRVQSPARCIAAQVRLDELYLKSNSLNRCSEVAGVFGEESLHVLVMRFESSYSRRSVQIL